MKKLLSILMLITVFGYSQQTGTLLKPSAINGYTTNGKVLITATDGAITGVPSWTNTIPFSMITGTTSLLPTTTSLTINGVTKTFTSTPSFTVGDLLSTSSYTNPSWISSLDWNKISSAPSFITLSYLSATSPLNYNNSTGVFTLTPLTSLGTVTTGVWNGTAIANGYLANGAVANLSGTNSGDNATNTQYSGLVTNANHTGDATGATALTLATVNTNTGTWGSAANTPTYTVNGKGLITASGTVAIAIAESQVTNLVSDLAAKSPTLSPTFGGAVTLGQDASGGLQAVTYQQFQLGILGRNDKEAAKYATTAALPTVIYANGSSGVGATLTGAGVGALAIDGNTVVVGQRILVKDQVSTFQNGTYTVTTVGSGIVVFVLTRTNDFNQSSEINTGSTVFVVSGTTLGGTTWVVNSADSPVMGTDPITFVQTAGPGSYIAGTGINISGTTISVSNYTNLATLTGTETLTNKTLTAPILTTPTLGVASSTSENITGTGGNGYLELGTQTSTVSAGATNSVRLYSNAGSFTWTKASDGFSRGFVSTITANRTYTLPDYNMSVASLDGTETFTNKSLTSPTLTGVPTAPTAASSNSTTQIATTAYVDRADATDVKIASNLSDLNNVLTARNNLKIWDMFLTGGDQTTTSNVASSITDLVFTPTINKRYSFEGVIHVGCNNTGGVKFQLTIPTGATIYISYVSFTTATNVSLLSFLSASATLSSAGCQANNSGGFFKISGEVTMSSNSGTIQFGFASATNTQTSTIYQLGTQISVKQIN